jgi:Protein of unknown function (DUF1302)
MRDVVMKLATNRPFDGRHTAMGLALAALVFSPQAARAEGGSPWLPIPGQVSLGVFDVEQSGSDAYIGNKKLPISGITGGAATKYKRGTFGLRVDYGISDSLAFDATLAQTSVKVGGADSSSGLGDTTLGLRWRVVDEYETPSRPTVTLRAGAIIKGNYDGAKLAAIGKAANGIDVSAIIGKEVGKGISLWGELGFQKRDASVPTATYFEIGSRWRFAPKWNASLAYSDKKFGGSLDIGGAGFTPARFQQVREERSVIKLGLGYAIGSNQTLAVNFAKLVGGRNTVQDDNILGLGYSYSF